MLVRRTVSLRTIDAELWRALFSSMKAALLAVASVFYTAALVLYFVTQNIAWFADRLYRLIVAWRPVKPHVFQFDNVNVQQERGQEKAA